MNDENELEEIAGIKDVGYLLTRLKLAKQKNETNIQNAIVSRLEQIGLLGDEMESAEVQFANLRATVNDILGVKKPIKAGAPAEGTAGTTSGAA